MHSRARTGVCTTLVTLPLPGWPGTSGSHFAEVQTILRHAHLDTTGHYLVTRIEDMHDKLQEHYVGPRPQRFYPAGYDPEDIKAVFGG